MRILIAISIVFASVSSASAQFAMDHGNAAAAAQALFKEERANREEALSKVAAEGEERLATRTKNLEETAERLAREARQAAEREAANRIDADGRLRVVSQKTRDQVRNREDARDKLAQLILSALAVPKPRRPTRSSLPSRRRPA